MNAGTHPVLPDSRSVTLLAAIVQTAFHFLKPYPYLVTARQTAFDVSCYPR